MLPKEYQPKALRPVEPISRPESFACGYEAAPGSYGMFAGPFDSLAEALEVIPAEDRPAFLFHFFPDGSDRRLYRWKEDRWILLQLGHQE